MDQFNQPELPGKQGFPMSVPDDLAQRMIVDIEHDGSAGGGFEPFAGASDSGVDAILKAERKCRTAHREHLRIFTPDGVEIYRRIGEPDSVPVDVGLLPGNIATHNHPRGTPPSLKDILLGAVHGSLEIRVTTSTYDYSIRFTGAKRGEISAMFEHLTASAYAVALDWSRSRQYKVSGSEFASRSLHAALMELARRGLLHYRRTVNVSL